MTARLRRTGTKPIVLRDCERAGSAHRRPLLLLEHQWHICRLRASRSAWRRGRNLRSREMASSRSTRSGLFVHAAPHRTPISNAILCGSENQGLGDLFALHRTVPGRDHERIPFEYCFSRDMTPVTAGSRCYGYALLAESNGSATLSVPVRPEVCRSRESLQSAQQEQSWKHSDSVTWH